MSDKSAFDEVLEAVEHLPVDQQSHLVDVVQRRLAERGRKQIVAEVRDGRAEYSSGNAAPVSVNDLLKDVTS